MKAIMISIKSQWVAKILNGEKTIEIRKTCPECDLPIDVYIYCTKDNKDLLHKNCVDIWWLENKAQQKINKELKVFPRSYNGKVVAKFTLNRVEETFFQKAQGDNQIVELIKKACVSEEQLWDYVANNLLFAWHIENLEIFDRPKELREYRHWIHYKSCNTCPHFEDNDYFYCVDCRELKSLEKAPQSWCYINI